MLHLIFKHNVNSLLNEFFRFSARVSEGAVDADHYHVRKCLTWKLKGAKFVMIMKIAPYLKYFYSKIFIKCHKN